ncbi:MAG: two-component system, cell cycle response regulator [Thermoanaerobaculia bacterium]|nr:two-component system, cell cycle response regulator [Thermoanaerobaculia bacterium]
MTIEGRREATPSSILVVEDDPEISKLLRFSLETNGFVVSSAATLEEAREILGGCDGCNVVLLDRYLPDGESSPLCRWIRANRPYSYVLMVTGESSREAKISGFASGADDYVTKPFEMDELLARVRAGIRVVGMQKQLLDSNRRYEDLSLTDTLTTLRNRRAFDQAFATRFEQARRHGRALSIALIDLDNFKTINDQKGHSAGDEVLLRIARILGRGTRETDFVARIGGDEFAVLLPETSLVDARRFADAILEAIRADDSVLQVTASIGLASVPFSILADSQMLFDAADKALYRAKKRGRNCVESERRRITVREPMSDAAQYSRLGA